jgi:hypothetical protein
VKGKPTSVAGPREKALESSVRILEEEHDLVRVSFSGEVMLPPTLHKEAPYQKLNT